ncbi:MAG: epoxyqueuosine reductase QueH [Lachnospiraceae bacterium]|nr:epoxyqueuosine reductase QueH [Lachnospiraceae bacterium]
MNQRNFQKELEHLLEKQTEKKKLLLHCCCAPCSSYVLEYLHPYFDITVFFYNPNITVDKEYGKRKQELKRYIREVSFGSEISVREADYEPEQFLSAVRGYEKEPERGKRCQRCFLLRLEKTAIEAAKGGFDYFCTTLSISPHKDARLLMETGETLAKEYGISYLPSDFKKRNGYKRSIELSGQYNLYRQDYCGCIFSKNQRDKRKDAEKGIAGTEDKSEI